MPWANRPWRIFPSPDSGGETASSRRAAESLQRARQGDSLRSSDCTPDCLGHEKMNFVFWNLDGKDLSAEVCSLASAHSVDVLVLAECNEPKDMESTLTSKVGTYNRVTKDESRVHVFTTFSDSLSQLVEDGFYYAALEMRPPLLGRLLLVGVHFPSKLYQQSESLAQESTVLAARILKLEQKAGHARTVVMGDLNMDPFESGVVGAAGLHAVAVRDVANRISRKVGGQAYNFFYNPTWAHLSDRHGGPPGTYFRQDSEHLGYFWHALDQVLLRPALIELFSTDGLRVLDRAGDIALMKKGRPSASDHLPLLLTLSSLGG
jgi:hypothetical protein